MRSQDDAQDLGLAIVVLCGLTGWTQAKLSRESGVDRGLISDYVAGIKRPTAKTLERIAAAFDTDVAFLEQLVPVCRRIRSAWRSKSAAALEPGEALPGLAEAIGRAAVAAMEPFLLHLSMLDRKAAPQTEDRE